MNTEALNCPNCGAPLPRSASAGPWLCIYCNSLVRLEGETPPGAPASAVSATQLDPAELDAIKQMLVSGQREAAIQAYQRLAGLQPEQARRAIEQMAADFSVKTVLHQRLTIRGLLLVSLYIVLLLASLYAWNIGRMHPLLALVIAGFSAFQLVFYARAVASTIRYLGSRRAPATVLHYARIGAVRMGQMRVHTYRFILEVQPENEPAFQAEAVIPVGERNVPRVRQGERFQVRYLPGKPESVVFDRLMDS